jgi:Spy/CpxP family protein refolding chaperone
MNYLDFIVLSGTLLAIVSFGVWKTRGQMDGKRHIMERLNLTEDQQNQIETLRKGHLDKVQGLQADLKIKEAELDAAMLDENTKSVNSIVSSINDLRSELFTLQVNHHLDVKALLDEDQKRIFDQMLLARGPHDGPGKGRGHGHGLHEGQGPRFRQQGRGN